MSTSCSWRVPALVLAVLVTGCARSSSAEPPLVQLEPRDRAPVVAGATVDEAAPSAPGDAAPSAPGGVCDIAHDRDLAGDLARWPEYRDPLADALGPEHDIDELLDLVAPDRPLTARGVAAMDTVWTMLNDRCDGDPHTRLCQDLLFYMLSDPLGRGAAGEDPVEVEAAFDLAQAKLRGMISAVAADAEVGAALEAHLTVVSGARQAFEAAGWGPDGVAGLEPLAEELMALGEVEVTEPLGYLEGSCGLW